MSDAIFGFLGGILTALIASLIASIVQRKNEEYKRKEQTRFWIYLRLLAINQQYFWLLTAEIHQEEPPKEIVENLKKLCWELADKLRECDSVEMLEEILIFLFSASLNSYRERGKLLDEILEAYGKIINPKYADQIRKISDDNILLFGTGSVKIKPPTSII